MQREGCFPASCGTGFLGRGEMEADEASCLEPRSQSGIAAETSVHQCLPEWPCAFTAQLSPLLATPRTQHLLLESLQVLFFPLGACLHAAFWQGGMFNWTAYLLPRRAEY